MSEILFLDIGKNSVQIHWFSIVFSIGKNAHTSVTRYPILMGFESKWSIFKLWEFFPILNIIEKKGIEHCFCQYLKTISFTSDSFLLIMSHIIANKYNFRKYHIRYYYQVYWHLISENFIRILCPMWMFTFWPWNYTDNCYNFLHLIHSKKSTNLN